MQITDGGMPPTESEIREALRAELLTSGQNRSFQEFWIPKSNGRVDFLTIDPEFHAFEIKSDRDTLGRLQGQVESYSRVFERCTLVTTRKHAERAFGVIPIWWGMIVVSESAGACEFARIREAEPNPQIDPEVVVRLLWKAEVTAALDSLSETVDPRSARTKLWRQLLQLVSLEQLLRIARDAIVSRHSDVMLGSA